MSLVFGACINSLPDEVLIEVFAGIISDYAYEGREYRAAAHFMCEARTTLRLVSQRWNDITISTCKLWSRIEIYASKCPSGEFHYNPPIHVIKLWLQRSGEMRLNLDLKLSRNSRIMEKYIEELLDVLWPLSHQWERLRLGLGGAWKNVFVRRPIPAVGLKAVVMLSTVLWVNDGRDGPSIIKAIAEAPNLCCLIWDCLSDSSARSMVGSFPLSQLTRLDLGAVTVGFESIIDIFRHANRATWISLQSDGMTHKTGVVNLSRVDLPNLRVLKLSVPIPDLDHILHLLNCPCLQVLRISPAMSGHYEPNVTDTVSAFVSDIGQSLQVLQFTRWTHVGVMELFKNPMFLRIPTMMADISWVGDAPHLFSALDKILDEMWEGFSGLCKIAVNEGRPCPGWVKKVAEDTGFSLSFEYTAFSPCLVMGWANPSVLPRFEEYFWDDWVGFVPKLFLSTDEIAHMADKARDCCN